MVLGNVVAAAAGLTRPPRRLCPHFCFHLPLLVATFAVHIFLFLARQFPICILTISFSHCAVSFSLLLFVLLCVSAFCRNELCDFNAARCASVLARIAFVTFLKQKVKVRLEPALPLALSLSVFLLSLFRYLC